MIPCSRHRWVQYTPRPGHTRAGRSDGTDDSDCSYARAFGQQVFCLIQLHLRHRIPALNVRRATLYVLCTAPSYCDMPQPVSHKSTKQAKVPPTTSRAPQPKPPAYVIQTVSSYRLSEQRCREYLKKIFPAAEYPRFAQRGNELEIRVKVSIIASILCRLSLLTRSRRNQGISMRSSFLSISVQ